MVAESSVNVLLIMVH